VRARKTDGNTTDIVKRLREHGLTVDVTNDKWDLTIGFGGVTFIAEVRPEGQKAIPRKGRQRDFHDTWTGGIYWLQTLTHADNLANCIKDHHRWIQEGVRRDLLKGSEWLRPKGTQ
jgi:hypothetical protein